MSIIPASGSLPLVLRIARAGGEPPVPVDPTESSVTLDPITAASGASIVVTITARDENGNPLSGRSITSVVIAPVDGGSVSGTGNTNGSGVATRTITAGTVGTGYTVTVTVGGVTLDDEPTFDVTEAPPQAGFWTENFWTSGFWTPNFWVTT